MQAAITQFAEIIASTNVQTAAQPQPVEPTPEGASTTAENPEIVNDDLSIPDDELPIFPGEISKEIFEYSPLAQLLISWTCTDMYKKYHIDKPSVNVIAEAAASSNLFAYNILASANWLSALTSGHPYRIGKLHSDCVADFFVLSTPADELMEICARKEVSYKAMDFLIRSTRPDALYVAEQLIGVAPHVMMADNHKDLLTTAMNAKSRPFIDLITGYRTFGVRIKIAKPGSLNPKSRYVCTIETYTINRWVETDDASMIGWLLERGVEVGGLEHKIIAAKPPTIIELLRGLGYDLD